MAGYLLYGSINKKSFKDFFIDKIVRLCPVIWFVVLFGFFWGVLKLEHMIMSSFMLGNTLLQFNFAKTGMFWFVCVFFWSSIILYFIINNFDRKKVYFLLIFIIHYISSHRIETNSSPHTIYPFCLIYGISMLSLGYFLKIIYEKNKNMLDNKNVVLITFFELLLFFLLFIGKRNVAGEKNIVFSFFIFCWLFLLFVYKKGFLSNFLENEVCSFLGKYSYSIYLTKEGIFNFFNGKEWFLTFKKYLLTNYFFDKDLCWQLFYVFLQIMLGVLTYHLVEKPGADWLKKRLVKKEV
jgi:peptidoglycan/LPS O-acetylase OafA/YrhL